MSDKIQKFVWLIVLAVIVAAGVSLFSKKEQGAPAGSPLDPNLYQSVILDNNLLYFGKLAKLETQWPVLSDVYYLREKAQEKPTAKAGTEGNGLPKFDLMKLGNTEIHQPQDSMVLNRDHILYWTNLKADSQVIKLIDQGKAKQK